MVPSNSVIVNFKFEFTIQYFSPVSTIFDVWETRPFIFFPLVTVFHFLLTVVLFGLLMVQERFLLAFLLENSLWKLFQIVEDFFLLIVVIFSFLLFPLSDFSCFREG